MTNCESCQGSIKTTHTFDKSKMEWCSLTACDCNVIEIKRSKNKPQVVTVATTEIRVFTLGGKQASTCKACKSATLVSMLNQGLCKVCDARRLANESDASDITAPEEGSLEEEGVEIEALEAMGLDPRNINRTPSETRTLTPAEALRAKSGLINDNNLFFKPTSVAQIGALKKMGWDIKDILLMKLSVKDASTLLQKGPKWLLK